MTAVVTTIDTVKEEGLLSNAARVGEVIRSGLSSLPKTEVRGMGLMIGVEFEEACGELVKAALDAGLVINVTADKVVRIMPPLVMSEAEGAELVRRLAPLAKAFLGKRAAA
jgi:acetylornithine aminotransferase